MPGEVGVSVVLLSPRRKVLRVMNCTLVSEVESLELGLALHWSGRV